LKKTILTLLLSLGAITAHAGASVYALDAAASTLVASALKNESVTVKVSFPGLGGSLDLSSGVAVVGADLKKLSTGDVARDSNIQSLFFEVAKKAVYGQATFNWKGVPAELKALKTGEAKAVTLSGTLTIHGSKVPLSGPAELTLLANGNYKASLKNWKLSIQALKLGGTLANLNKLCPQPHRVADEVLLNGELVFKKP